MLARFKRISNLILFVLSVSLLCGCVSFYNPATGRQETLLIDTKSEVALGQDMDKEVQREMKIYDDPNMTARLERIGSRVAAYSDRQDITYHFKVIKNKEMNAFAVPGGFIYVHSALMNAVSDDELACVLGHEIGHLAARHGVKRLQAVLGYQLIMSIALGVGGKETMSQAMDVVFNLASLGYSRKDETLADKLAVRYSKRAGFNPYAMITFFNKLKKEETKNGTGKLVFLSSHPALDERIKNVQQELAYVSGLSKSP